MPVVVSTAAATPDPPVPRSYTVEPGDSWFGIAAKLKVSPKRLEAVNGATDETVLQPKQTISVPDEASPVVAVPPRTAVPTAPPRTAAPAPPPIFVATPQPTQATRLAFAPSPADDPVPVAPVSGPRIQFEGNGGGPTLCEDGSVSGSAGRGTCSHHGGVSGGSHRGGGGGRHGRR